MAKTIAVFGAGSGMGKAVARRFGQEGYRIALVARRREPLNELVDALAAEGIEAAGFTADLSHTDGIPGLVTEIRKRFGRIDVVNYAPFSPAIWCTTCCRRCWSAETAESCSSTVLRSCSDGAP
ncbi:SDR family NAD(P)-dependent oxidoreductase [Streptomyces malaysiensis]|uniref:SDR family NAD(P)-dependent oxidoreductase n=2 Tax=Streptomyces malaysiensis TaxID=92644 RepID=UPI003417604E